MTEILEREPTQEQLKKWLSDFVISKGELATQCLDAVLKNNLALAIASQPWGVLIRFEKLWECYETAPGILSLERVHNIYQLSRLEKDLLKLLSEMA